MEIRGRSSLSHWPPCSRLRLELKAQLPVSLASFVKNQGFYDSNNAEKKNQMWALWLALSANLTEIRLPPVFNLSFTSVFSHFSETTDMHSAGRAVSCQLVPDFPMCAEIALKDQFWSVPNIRLASRDLKAQIL